MHATSILTMLATTNDDQLIELIKSFLLRYRYYFDNG